MVIRRLDENGRLCERGCWSHGRFWLLRGIHEGEVLGWILGKEGLHGLDMSSSIAVRAIRLKSVLNAQRMLS